MKLLFLLAKKYVPLKVCGVNRPGTSLFARLFSHHPAFRECLYLGITLDSRINANSLYMYLFFFLSNPNLLKIFFSVDFSCEVFLSNSVKCLANYQSPFFIPFLEGEPQTPKIT